MYKEFLHIFLILTITAMIMCIMLLMFGLQHYRICLWMGYICTKRYGINYGCNHSIECVISKFKLQIVSVRIYIGV